MLAKLRTTIPVPALVSAVPEAPVPMKQPSTLEVPSLSISIPIVLRGMFLIAIPRIVVGPLPSMLIAAALTGTADASISMRRFALLVLPTALFAVAPGCE
jgi:hypothetical protein